MATTLTEVLFWIFFVPIDGDSISVVCREPRSPTCGMVPAKFNRNFKRNAINSVEHGITSLLARRDLNPRPLLYQSSATTNCATSHVQNKLSCSSYIKFLVEIKNKTIFCIFEIQNYFMLASTNAMAFISLRGTRIPTL